MFLPGFLLFAAGGPGGLLLPGGKANDKLWLIIPGIVLCVTGLVRGVILMYRYRRCPVCDAYQPNKIRMPHYQCMECGARLSNSWKGTA